MKKNWRNWTCSENYGIQMFPEQINRKKKIQLIEEKFKFFVLMIEWYIYRRWILFKKKDFYEYKMWS